MDADGSHAPEELPRLLDALADADVVLGSRWVPGGRTVNWPMYRQFISRGGNLYSRLALGVPFRDVTGGYRAYRIDALDKMDVETVASQGYCFQVDLAWRALRNGFRSPRCRSRSPSGSAAQQDEHRHRARSPVARHGLGRRCPAGEPEEARERAAGQGLIMRRLWIIVAALVIVPIVEIAVLIGIGQVIGLGWTLLLMLVTSFIGGWLLRKEGSKAWRAFQADLAERKPPGNTATDGLLVLIGGIFMLVPGFVSDAIGLFFILPPTRRLARAFALRVIAPRMSRRRHLPVRAATGPGPRLGVRPPRVRPRPPHRRIPRRSHRRRNRRLPFGSRSGGPGGRGRVVPADRPTSERPGEDPARR